MIEATTHTPPCLVCGYDLTGIESPVCPECATPRVVQPQSGFVAQPWPCIRCGYSLLGAPQAGTCPECGLGVPRSLDPSLLRMRPVETLRTLQSGALLTTLGIVLPVFGPCFGSSLLGFAGLSGVAALMVINTLGWVVLLLGVWRITKPLGGADPSARRKPLIPLLFRWFTAIAAACSAAIFIIMYSVVLGQPSGHLASSTPLLQFATVTMLFLCAVTGLLHARSLMRLGVRKGKRGGAVAISALVVLIVAVGLTISLVFFGGLALLSSPSQQGAFGVMAGIVALGAGLAWFTAYISLLGVSERLRLLVRHERRIAERAHAAARAERPIPAESNA